MERQLQIKYAGEPISGSFIDFIKSVHDTVSQDPANYLFNTLWLITRKSDNTAIVKLHFMEQQTKMGKSK